jgi:hypothetical protein
MNVEFQAMMNSATRLLNDKEYVIGGYATRDRSWGDPWSEPQSDIPPWVGTSARLAMN